MTLNFFLPKRTTRNETFVIISSVSIESKHFIHIEYLTNKNYVQKLAK